MTPTQALYHERRKSFHAKIAETARRLQVAMEMPAPVRIEPPPVVEPEPKLPPSVAPSAWQSFLDVQGITIDKIQRAVCAKYMISKRTMIGVSRIRSNVYPRQIAMYLCHELTDNSLPEIGRRFGNRDHTTVLHAIRKIEKLIETDTDLCLAVQELKDVLGYKPTEDDLVPFLPAIEGVGDEHS